MTSKTPGNDEVSQDMTGELRISSSDGEQLYINAHGDATFGQLNVTPLTVTGTYIGDMPPYQFSPVPQWRPQWPQTHPTPNTYPYPGIFPRRQAHVSSDPTLVNHCPFCGSGALVGRSDGGIDCNICNKTFRVSEQPMYSNMPSTEEGAGIESTENDPLTAEDPFEAPDEAMAPEEEDGAVPAGGEESDEERELPGFLSSKNGTPLDDDDFILHHAIRSIRGS